MTQVRLGRSVGVGLVSLGLGLGAWLLGAGPASGGNPPTGDGAPSGAVAFVAGGACPTGWAPMAGAEGRLLVGVTDGTTAGITVGTPLGDQENREHAHDYSAGVTLDSQSAGAFDGPNDDGAAAQTYTVTGTTAQQVTGLPFIQVQACVKQ